MAYMHTLDNGHIPDDLTKIIKTRDHKKIKGIISLTGICIKATTVTDEGKAKEVQHRQDIFVSYITGYAESYNKKSNNVVIIGGRALSGDEVTGNIKNLINAKKKSNLVVVDGQYMDKKNAIAGLFGETTLEHVLYKAYYRLLMDTYKTTNISQFIKEWSSDEVMDKIEALRNSKNPWTEEETKFIEEPDKGIKNTDIYKKLIRAHSDRDILDKALELNNPSFIGYCRMRTQVFENNYKAFIEKYISI